MIARVPLLSVALALSTTTPCLAQGNDLTAPLVAIVADDAPGLRLDALLREAGMRTRRVAVADCTPARLRFADVVLVDWPGEAPLGEALPLGALDRWDRPTVFVGTSGDRFASRWGLPTLRELAEPGGPARGPEVWTFTPPAGATTEVFRQGHLCHCPRPVAELLATAAERAWFAATVRHTARFATDRPILRHASANGAPLPPAEVVRRQRLDAAAQQLALDVTDRDVLLALADRLQGGDAHAAAALLDDLLPDGLEHERSRTNWRNWLRARREALVFDPLALVWRLDRLAFARGVPSAQLVGDARADGAEREPEAVALAVEVARHYGGRAFDDLATFTCWRGEVCYLWDRREGIFRMENHHVLRPGAFAMAWEVSVFDTAADRELIWGGGPPPRPRVSARADYREILTRLFLPALLLEPGTSLRRSREGDTAGLQRLVVRLAQRGADPKQALHLLVDPDTGAIASVESWLGDRNQATWMLEATTACGPLLLPTGWSDEQRRRRVRFAIDEATWNPVLPAGLATAAERLTRPRDR
jgi:hypothetical protein